MDLTALQTDVASRTGLSTSDATSLARINRFINETQQEIVAEPGMETLLNDDVTFASVASTPTYALPQAVARVKSIRDTTNLLDLTPMSEAEWRERYPSPTIVTGTPARWVDLGVTPVSSQPSTADKLYVISDSASDGATKKAFIEGYVTGGYLQTASVALNGITAAQLGTLATWIEVTKIYIALTAGGETTAAGNVSLLQTSAVGTELARIPIGAANAKARRIALAICPASAITYSMDLVRDVTDLAQATDEPIIPLRFHRLLAIGARMKEYEKQDQTRYLAAKAEFEKGVRKLKFWVFSQAVGTPNLRGAVDRQRPSQLGGYFPANS